MIKIRTGNQLKKYIGRGDIDYPEIYFHQDEVIAVATAYLIAGRTMHFTINTRDPMLVEAFEVLTEDENGEVEFYVDDIYEDKKTKRQIKPCELYVLYNTMGRAYNDKIDLYRLIMQRVHEKREKEKPNKCKCWSLI